MDATPARRQNDSGYTSASPPNVKRILRFPSFESTPSTSRSRKRKSEPCETNVRKLSDIEEQDRSPVQFNSLYDSGYNGTHDDSNPFLRGTFDKSSPVDQSTDDMKISSSLEKCSLEESPHSAKKYKWDDEEVICEVKSCSAPGTPQRQNTDRDKDHSLRKFYSLDLTPTKGTSVKIGTPERLEILYPKLIEVKSPSKIRSELKRRTKPARKRLFHCRDFVHIFTNIKKVEHVIKNIFSYLSDTDLVNVAKVSKLWRKTLELNQGAWKRYKMHLKNITVRKENIYFSQVDTNSLARVYGKEKSKGANMRGSCNGARSPPVSPNRVNWAKFVKWGAGLSGTQRLTKCVACGRPAVMDRGLARCSGPNCGYLFCTRCLGGSRHDSTAVSCRCAAGTPPHVHALADVSNIDTASLYFSDKALDHSDKKIGNVLTDCNDNSTEKQHCSSSTGGSFNILQHTTEIHKAKHTLKTKKKAIEPGSPQKVKTYAAGSKQSKRNLRRL